MLQISRAHAHTNTLTPVTQPTKRRVSRSLAAAALAGLAAIGLTLASASPALAHDELVGVDGAFTNDQTAFEVTLSFNNKIMDIGSETIVKGADGTQIDVDPPKVSGRDVVQSVPVPAEEQAVMIDWRVVSSDGHPIQGKVEIQFAGDDTTVSIPDPRFVDEDADADAGAGEAAHEDGDGHDAAEHAATGNLENDSPSTGDAATPALIWVGVAVVVLGVGGTALILAMRRKSTAALGAGGAGTAGAAGAAGADTAPDVADKSDESEGGTSRE